MIALSLNQDVDPQRLIQSIVGLIQKNVTSKEEAESSILRISISKVSRTIEPDLIRNIEA
jgi:hypothetical protein